MMELNRKQQKFIDLYVHGENATLAAIGAGYPKEFGIQLYANPQIRAEIDRKLAIVSKKMAELLAERETISESRTRRSGQTKKR